MPVLGAIIAGGQSRRFGADKAVALLNGVALLDHVVAGLQPQVDAMIVCGRDWPGMVCVPDRPVADLGPLGGLAAALHYGAAHSYDVVLTAGCDVLPVWVPPSLTTEKPLHPEAHYVFGLWPTALSKQLDDYLRSPPDLSIRSWIAASGAKAVACDTVFHNLNTPDDLSRFGA